ncbi:HXXEE domain-containing protein (plasmid) [Clostridium estertheticum]|uniref:HXXEE domain-containing protein n=1 Tax=Clostridium estertheticum TaxID=238834 RepID=UPI001C7CD992|nr:HXXEE domain-containing protein [Clostridium estertheticum]MBX4262797.1 HXXEE domain-containing protein [Clostridium estertheticum]WLC72856.1 HXXEE domain-containing protein [Clostridium estertheticum]
MNNIQVIIWLFPILFIFHDLEEIIFIQPWISKNRLYLCERFPVLSKKLLPHFDNITTSSFAFGVAEEFILISIITVISYVMNWYSLWIGLFIAFTFHLVVHCFQTLIVRKYVPAIVTSIFCLPICMYIIKHIVQLFTLGTVVLYSIFGFIIMVINLGVIHKFMDVFSKWLAQYEHQR